jgi:hypothetical protein
MVEDRFIGALRVIGRRNIKKIRVYTEEGRVVCICVWDGSIMDKIGLH